MSLLEQLGYYGLHTLATPLLWWTVTIVAVLLYFKLVPVRRPRIRYYVIFGVLLSLPVGTLLSFMPSGIYTSIPAPETMTWIAAPEITIRETDGSASSLHSPAAFWSGIILTGCLSVILFGIYRLILNTLSLRKLKQNALPLHNTRISSLLNKLQSELRVTRPVQLMTRSDLTSPVSFGWKYPVIILPENCNHSEISTLKPVLLHELHHIKNCDYLLSVLTEILITFTAFHPGARMMRKELYRYQEMHCDVQVLGCRRCSAAEYAEILLSFSGFNHNSDHRLACSMARSGSQIRERIVLMSQYPESEKSNRSLPARAAPALAFTLFMGATMITSCDLNPSELD